ncbi:MAG: S4 domain-containing protein, partial [Acidobacteriota bacterium]|nr:S4 domain-containing protein [Acidobacteriota bacterium]
MDSTHRKSLPDSETLMLTVSEADVGNRLDAYLAAQIDGWSRARLQHLIDEGEVLVNGNRAKTSYKVSAKDEIEVELTPAPYSNFIPENIPLDIVFEDEDVIIINKPAGLVVHPAAGIHSGTLANALA